MGMFDTICAVPVKCPKCGDEGVKNVKIRNGDKIFTEYIFCKDKIPMDWDSGYPGSLIQLVPLKFPSSELFNILIKVK